MHEKKFGKNQEIHNNVLLKTGQNYKLQYKFNPSNQEIAQNSKLQEKSSSF